MNEVLRDRGVYTYIRRLQAELQAARDRSAELARLRDVEMAAQQQQADRMHVENHDLRRAIAAKEQKLYRALEHMDEAQKQELDG